MFSRLLVPICRAFVMYFSALCLFNCSLLSDVLGCGLQVSWREQGHFYCSRLDVSERKGSTSPSDSSRSWYRPCRLWRLSTRCSLLPGRQIALESLIHYWGEGRRLFWSLGCLCSFLPLSFQTQSCCFSHLLFSNDVAVFGTLKCSAGLAAALWCWMPWALLLAALQGLGWLWRYLQPGSGWRYSHTPFLMLVPSSKLKCCLYWSLAGPGRPPNSLYGLNLHKKWMQHGNPTSWAETEQMPAGGVSSCPTLGAVGRESLLLNRGGNARPRWSWVLRFLLLLRPPERRGETREWAQ